MPCVVCVQQTQEEWRWVFFLAALIFVLGFVCFFLFGSGDVQPWAIELDEFEIDNCNEKSSTLTNGMTELGSVKETQNGAKLSNGSSQQLEEEVLIHS